MYALLTSCGLETETIENAFKDMLTKEPSKVKALFIINAVDSPDAVEMLPKCLNDLLKCGIERKNIFVYDLYGNVYKDYDVIYLCGGNPEHLLMAINDSNFRDKLMYYINRGSVIIGVSAGSMIFADDMPENLGLLKCELDVHCKEKKRTPAGSFDKDRTEKICLSDKQAVLIKTSEKSKKINEYSIIE